MILNCYPAFYYSLPGMKTHLTNIIRTFLSWKLLAGQRHLTNAKQKEHK